MTTEQKQSIRTSFQLVLPIAPIAAGLFYERLFTIAPHVKPLFTSDIKEQGKKLMAMLGSIVSILDAPERLVPMLTNLGRRHVEYGVKVEYFAPVGEALIWTLQQGLGEHFTEETKQAWLAAFNTIKTVMSNAMTEQTNAEQHNPTVIIS